MLRTEVLSQTIDGRGQITRAETALFCVISSIFWLGAHTYIETAGAAEETMSQGLSYALTVLTIERRRPPPKPPVPNSGNAHLPVP